MDWIELAQYTNRWDVRLWNVSSWLRIRICGLCGYGLDRAASGFGQVGCAVMDWIELTEDTDRCDLRLWTGSSWLRIRTSGIYGYGMDRAGLGYA